jgi:hypothetical protein
VAGTGGTVYVPDGVYMLRGVRKKTLALKSKTTLKLADRPVLKVIPNGAPRYMTVRIADASYVNVVGATLRGDRKEHKGKKGEWGMGLWIGRGSAHVTVVGVTAKDMWGDGFYINDAVNVVLCGVNAINNRRQGLSIISGNRIFVTRSEFRDTTGTSPSTGIDLEPNKPHQRISNVTIEKSKFVDNAGGSILAGKVT